LIIKDHLKVEVTESIDRKVSHDWQFVKLGDIAYEISDRVDNPSQSGLERFVGLEHLGVNPCDRTRVIGRFP
jgi:hypothetical protein